MFGTKLIGLSACICSGMYYLSPNIDFFLNFGNDDNYEKLRYLVSPSVLTYVGEVDGFYTTLLTIHHLRPKYYFHTGASI